MKKIFFIILFIHISSFGTSQCKEIYFKGEVRDSSLIQSFYNLMIVNQTTRQGVYGRPDGQFSMYVRPGDKIAFSVAGYNKQFIEIPKRYECSIDTIIYLTPKIQQYEEVIVYPIKSLEDIKKEREAISMRETRTVKGVNIFYSPITALYERFSKEAKSKQKLATMQHQDNINKIVKELLSAYVSYDVVYLGNENFEDFIYFLNINEHFLKTASDYELIIYIQQKLEHYKELHPELFK